MSRTARPAEVRVKPDGSFVCRAVTYESSPDSYGSIFARGSLTEGLNRRNPVVCMSHDWGRPIGRVRSWSDDPSGPVLECRLDVGVGVADADAVYAQLRSGTLDEVSIGFDEAERRDPTDAERKRWPGVREVITKATVLEISTVVKGAVPGAAVLSVRSEPIERERVRLGRMLARGEITQRQYAGLLEAERAADEALATVERSHMRRMAEIVANRSLPQAERRRAHELYVQLRASANRRTGGR